MSRNGYRHPFLVGTSYLGGVGDIPRTITDLALSKLSATIRQTDNKWYTKYSDKIFREHWLQHAIDRTWVVESGAQTHRVQLSAKQVEYALDELEGYARLVDQTNQCEVSCFERIWESGALLESSFLETLDSQLDSLRGSLNSASTVDDIRPVVDPHMCCLRYNRTLISNSAHRRHRTAQPPDRTDIYTVSQRFAMLPTEAQILTLASGDLSVRFRSYINNIHPSRKVLYQALSKLVSRFVPLLEHTLTDLHRNNPLTRRICGSPRYMEWDEPEEPEHSDDEEGWTQYEMSMRSWVLHRPIQVPDVPQSGYPGSLELRNFNVSLRDRTLKIIARIEDIPLTPNKANYNARQFRVEGMKNERVVANALYFPTVTNVETPHITFRMAVSYPRGFAPGDVGATTRGWGLHDGSPCNQLLGSTPIREGFGLTFPNIYQYRLEDFGLLDRSRPGRVTMVSLLLIDPDIPAKEVLSTTQIGPQQASWIRQALDESLDKRIPEELVEHIMEFVLEDDWVLTEEASRAVKAEVDEERAQFVKHSDLFHFSVAFDVWNGPELPI